MKRSDIRETVFKLLFRLEFNDISEMDEQTNLFFENETDELKFKISEEDREYITDRAKRVLEKLPDIDREISEKATGWTIDRMGKVDVAIIRLAVFELLFDDDIPTGVSINEAVELAKKYGRDESGAFVNGVLAKFAK